MLTQNEISCRKRDLRLDLVLAKLTKNLDSFEFQFESNSQDEKGNQSYKLINCFIAHEPTHTNEYKFKLEK